MDKLYSYELKAVVVTDNFLDNPLSVMKENCLTVQHFDYLCEHKRNDSNQLFGATQPVIMNFTVRVNSPRHAKTFYQRLLNNGYESYTFLFNATYNENQRLKDYDDGMVVDGYVIRIEESYQSEKDANGTSEQMTLDIQLLLRSVTYLGRSNNHTNTFIK